MPVDAQKPMPMDMPAARGGAAAPANVSAPALNPNPMQADSNAPAMPLPAGEAGAAPGPEVPAPVPPADDIPVCANSMLTPGESDGTIDIGGTSRSYIVHVPPTYDGKTPMPLILDFPALTQSASGQRGASGNAALADQEGIVVVYPNGIGGAFNICPTDNPKTDCRCCTDSRDVDDLSFALELVKKMKREGCIDPKRVYATGYSMGGGMDYFLACYAADVFAAVAASSFDMVVMDQIPCVPSRPITVVSSRGTGDGVVEYGGSVSSFGLMFQGAVGSWEMWKEINGCTGEPEDTGMGCQSYKNCAAPGVEATLCTVEGGGHSPGSATLLWSHIKDSALP
jgi:polyhydroxybutyrate depolymerase